MFEFHTVITAFPSDYLASIYLSIYLSSIYLSIYLSSIVYLYISQLQLNYTIVFLARF